MSKPRRTFGSDDCSTCAGGSRSRGNQHGSAHLASRLGGWNVLTSWCGTTVISKLLWARPSGLGVSGVAILLPAGSRVVARVRGAI